MKKISRSTIIIILLSVALAVAIGGCIYLWCTRDAEPTNTESSKEDENEEIEEDDSEPSVIFTYMLLDGQQPINPTDDILNKLETAFTHRLKDFNITECDLSVDDDGYIITARIPWDEKNDPADAFKIQDILSRTRKLELYYDTAYSSFKPDKDQLILDQSYIKSVTAGLDPNTGYPIIELEFDEEGTAAFSQATLKQSTLNGTTGTMHTISIWLDDEMISNPYVSAHITDGKAVISNNQGGMSAEEAIKLASLFQAEILPFDITSLPPIRWCGMSPPL